MTATIDITGVRYGRLVAQKRIGSRGGHALWLCKCDCGKEAEKTLGKLRFGWTTKCGHRCELSVRHGYAKRDKYYPTYMVWANMKSRCGNPLNPEYKNYGGRGITFCDRWKLFDNFLEDMGDKPANTSIDRIDNDGNYEPHNCRWATLDQQLMNRRNSIYITMGDKKYSLKELAIKHGIAYNTALIRYNKGYPNDKIFTKENLRGRRIV